MKKALLILVSMLFLMMLGVVFFFFQHKTVNTGSYTVVYYKNRCNIDSQSLPDNLPYLKTLPCLIRITWQEPIASDMYQEYCYFPGKEVEKTRLIHQKK